MQQSQRRAERRHELAGQQYLYFSPASTLSTSTWYGIRLTAGTTGATDLAGNVLSMTGCPHLSGNDCYRTFRSGTGGGTPAGVSTFSPPDDSTGIGTNARISVTFTGGTPNPPKKTAIQNGFSLQQTSGSGSPCYVQGGTPLCTSSGGTFTWSGSTMTFTPTNALVANASYAWGVHQSCCSVNVDFDANFSTGSGPDTTAPTVSGTVPSNGSTGVDVASTVRVNFSEAMNQSVTSDAFTLQRYAGPGCTGGLTTIAGTAMWVDATSLVYTPSASLSAGFCHRVGVSTTAVDVVGNALAAAFSSTFTTLSGSDPTITLSGFLSGSLFYPGAAVTATGTNWTAGSGAVTAKWEDNSTLGSGTPSGGNVTINFNLPGTASAGSRALTFTRSGGGTEIKTITVRQPTEVVLSADRTDIAPGQSTTITATVYDNGQPAQNAQVSFSKTDPGSRGSFSVASGVTGASGQVSTVLSVSAGGAFPNITVTATAGNKTDSLVIVDPPPLPPTDLRASSGPNGLTLTWRASPTREVTGYRVALGTASKQYDQTANVGPSTSYTFAAARPGTTYYAVVYAYTADGALSDPTDELSVLVPLPTPTATPTRPTATPVPSPSAAPTASVDAGSPTPLRLASSPTTTTTPAVATATPTAATPTATTVPPTATPIVVAVSPTAIAVAASGGSTPTVVARLLYGTPTATATPTAPPPSATATPSPTSPIITATAAPMGTPGPLLPPTGLSALAGAGAPSGAPVVGTATPTPVRPTPSPTPLLLLVSPTPIPLLPPAPQPPGPSTTPPGRPTSTPTAAASRTATPAVATATVPPGQASATPAAGTATALAITAARMATPSPSPIVITAASPTAAPVVVATAPAVQLFASANQPSSSSSIPGATNPLFPSANQPSTSSMMPGHDAALFPSANQPPVAGTPTPSPSPTATGTPSTPTPGPSPTGTPATVTPGPSPTTTRTPTIGPSPTGTRQPTVGPTATRAPGGTGSVPLPMGARP